MIAGFSGNFVTMGKKGATIGGGGEFGLVNSVASDFGTVGGGFGNFASGLRSTVPGGDTNEAAGNFSFAAGRRAFIDAAHDGTFLWADGTGAFFSSTAANQFRIRATNGVDIQAGGLVVGSPTGGHKGAGTINAESVFDDNSQLNDYVFDWYFDGEVGDEDEELHGNYRMKSLDEMIAFIEKERHLPTIIGREEWNKKGKSSLGELVNHLWKTVETQAIYIKQLKERLDAQDKFAKEEQTTIEEQKLEFGQTNAELNQTRVELADMKSRMAHLEAALQKMMTSN